MMQSLAGIVSALDLSAAQQAAKLRFVNADNFKTPEALILYEQNMVDTEVLLDACQREYNRILDTPEPRHIPQEILDMFEDYDVFVADVDLADAIVTLSTIPEFANQTIISDFYQIKIVLCPIYHYVKLRTRQYGKPQFLLDLPILDHWKMLVDEAIRLDAMDITVSCDSKGARVYYNVRKHQVQSSRRLSRNDVEEIVKLLASTSGATLADTSAKPRFFDLDLDKHHRGRCVVNKTYYGLSVTIRILSNKLLDKTLEDLNLHPKACSFIRNHMLSREKGLRLFIGETASGKNTSVLAALMELVNLHEFKIVSVEQPVEILVDGIEQINAETDDEFAANADSLLRQNPDIVYFSEITARTATAIMQQSNTAKAVFSTIHANSIADVLFRLEDITHMPMDRLVLTLHSCVYQELVRDAATDTVKPYTRCVYFDDDLKLQLYGKPMSTIIQVLKGKEDEWDASCGVKHGY